LIGLTYDKVRENTFLPRLGVAPEILNNAVAYSTLGSRVQRYRSLYNDTYYSYKRKFTGDHSFEGNIGFRYQDSESEQDRALGYNSPSDDFVTIGFGTNSLRQIGGDIGKWRWLNTYLGMNYAFKSKYLLSFNLSADGSSRFGKNVEDVLNIAGNKYAVMPSAAAAWLISSENFMADLDAVELLKVRVSYGLTGNDDLGNYSARRYYVSQNLLGAQGFIRGNIGNPYLRWETVKKLNAGIDLSLFNERLSFSVDAYRNTTSNMVVYDELQTGAGFDFVVSNGGGMKNEGVEASLNARLVNKSIKWDIGATISSYRNRITSLPGNRGLVTSIGGATVLTEMNGPASQFYGFKTEGVFVSDAEAAAANQRVRTADGSLMTATGGDIRFVDLNDDGIIDDQDRTVIGNPNPDFFGGVNTNLSWKGLSLNALFTFSVGNDLYNGTRAILESVSQPMNQTQNVQNRWHYDGHITDMPKASYGDPLGNSRFSDRWIEKGSYLRLRTVSLSYSLPIKPQFMKYATLYATGNNLFTITKYLGYDPEMSSSGSVLSQGFDTAQEPQFKSVQLGVRIGL
jgi:TonB-linked SusC/RagA family outer membrane protein